MEKKETILIFLDFDGVLHPYPSCNEGLFCRARLLWKILRNCPEVLVVFSSSWRVFHEFDELVAFVTAGGGEDLTHRFIDCTPKIQPENYCGQRDIEVKCWLDINKYRGKWIAIDDMADQFFEDTTKICEHPNLYIVDGKKGLTEMDVTKLVERLGRIYHQ